MVRIFRRDELNQLFQPEYMYDTKIKYALSDCIILATLIHDKAWFIEQQTLTIHSNVGEECSSRLLNRPSYTHDY